MFRSFEDLDSIGASQQFCRLVGLILVILAVTAPDLEAQPACPSGHSSARSLVENFFTDPDLSEDRSEVGVTGIDTSQIGLLQDKGICETLDTNYDGFGYNVQKKVYYKASNRYFVSVPIVVSDEGAAAFGVSFLIVLDDSLSELQLYGF